MGQAEWLLVLTCAGYVAPYAWDRLRAEWRSWTTPVQVDTNGLRALIDEWGKQPVATQRRSGGTLRNSIRTQEVRPGEFFIRSAPGWCAPDRISYDFHSMICECE